MRISSEFLTAEFRPELGGRVSKLRHSSGVDILVPLGIDAFEALYWPKAGAYPLVPYHNRISNSQLQTQEGTISLQPHPQTIPHTLHGPAQLRPWSVKEHSANSLTMQIGWKPDEAWPWDFEAKQIFTVSGNSLELRFLLQNIGRSAMPAGLGWHPYFNSASPVAHDAEYLWPHRADYLPEGRRLKISNPTEVSKLKTAYLDTWSTVRFPLGNKLSVTLTASSIFEHLVIHQADDYSCIEPVTHVADGFNLKASGAANTGVFHLAPGKTLDGSIFIVVDNGNLP
ncbi:MULTISPECIES: hypothetical protein [Agrobacterium]|uniref:aldose epimerase family protein n=1 Tax=Agrobacterium TaxID=357 RepID=UPI00138AEB35|nr:MULTISPECIES: hypothetical protein [Agrobacterium]